MAVLPVLLVAACGGVSGAPAPSRPTSGAEDAAACQVQAAEGVGRLFADLSAGRWPAAERRVARDGFVWFVIGARRAGKSSLPRIAVNETVEVRDALGAYLRRRVRAHDEVVVRSLRVTQVPEGAGGALGFELAALRRADDLASRRWLPLVAKGEWLCDRDRLSGLAGHADLGGGPLPDRSQCPRDARVVAGVRVCGSTG